MNAFTFLLQRIARAVLKDYEIFLVLCIECEGTGPDVFGQEFVVHGIQHGEADESAIESWRFEYRRDGKVLCECAVWTGEHYRKARNFIPLAPGEGELVLLETVPEARGQGLAPRLLEYAVAQCGERGFHRLYCRIWHSNKPSIRAFTKAGWKRHQLALSLRAILARRPVEWRFRLQR